MTNRTTITAAMIAATITSLTWPASAAMMRTELQELCRPRVVLDYLDKTPPEKAFGLAGLLVETALWKAYPCPK